MRKTLLLLIIFSVLWIIPAQAESIFAVSDGGKEYYLDTDSLRFCANDGAIYIKGGDNPIIDAKFLIVGRDKTNGQSSDMFHDDGFASTYTHMLIDINTKQVALLGEDDYNRSGSHLNHRDPAHHERWVEGNTGTAKVNPDGKSTLTGVETQKVSSFYVEWLTITDGPARQLVEMTIRYANNHYYEVLDRSKYGNTMSAK